MSDEPQFSQDLLDRAGTILDLCRTRHIMLATAESCTGGLVAALLTEVAGSSDVVDRGLVTYSNEAKRDLLGVPEALLAEFGAVSRQTAEAMAAGALARSRAQVTVAITGIAGPGGGTAEKPVGLVHFAAAHASAVLHVERRFGQLSRRAIRLASVSQAFDLIERSLAGTSA